ncbi:hypothetical protein [Mycobacterium sp.]|uniref:hypothetical protein n=1 Tax=Mycobacterium sp. TaxID=1785 RepID=UPI0012260CBA|nr:hypothetical protein [Mycobacterium sp.]TAM65140.1 MAG: hypothetical protein EPN51_20160 [Mycobacterium sp.]
MNTPTLAGPVRSGTFNHAALASGRDFDPNDFVTNESILGLQREAGYIWGTLRDEDGTLYSTMRRIAATPPDAREDGRQSLGGKHILLNTGTGREGMQLRKEARYAVDSAAVQAELTDEGTATLSSAPDAEGQPMRLVLNKENFRYTEEGVIDMSGALAASPLQWYLPGRDASLLYISQTWLVDGLVVGKPARGFLFWEEAWMYPGGRLYMDKDPLHDAEYLTWYSWANHWDDGSCEIGHFLFGQRDFHVGVTAHSDGSVTSASSMDINIARAADGYWHDGITYTIDGVDWVCEPDPEGHMRGLGYMPNPQQEGRIHRADDTRMPDVWMAWGETVPAAGNSRRR